MDNPSEFIPERDQLPVELKVIADVIGVEKTIKLSRAFKGCKLYIRSIERYLRRKKDA
jgi:hypothetical protein